MRAWKIFTMLVSVMGNVLKTFLARPPAPLRAGVVKALWEPEDIDSNEPPQNRTL